MKTLYATIKQIFLAVLLMLAMTSCLSDLSYQEAITKNQRKIDDPEKLDDAKFLVEAKSFNLAEKRLTELASTNGYASTVVETAKKHLEDHKDMEDDLSQLARRERIKLPSDMNDEHQAYVGDLAKADRDDFDKEFLQTMKKLNEENTQRFMSMATDAQDADIRAFSARKLDMLRAHADQIERIEKELLNTY